MSGERSLVHTCCAYSNNNISLDIIVSWKKNPVPDLFWTSFIIIECYSQGIWGSSNPRCLSAGPVIMCWVHIGTEIFFDWPVLTDQHNLKLAPKIFLKAKMTGMIFITSPIECRLVNKNIDLAPYIGCAFRRGRVLYCISCTCTMNTLNYMVYSYMLCSVLLGEIINHVWNRPLVFTYTLNTLNYIMSSYMSCSVLLG